MLRRLVVFHCLFLVGCATPPYDIERPRGRCHAEIVPPRAGQPAPQVELYRDDKTGGYATGAFAALIEFTVVDENAYLERDRIARKSLSAGPYDTLLPLVIEPNYTTIELNSCKAFEPLRLK